MLDFVALYSPLFAYPKWLRLHDMYEYGLAKRLPLWFLLVYFPYLLIQTLACFGSDSVPPLNLP